MQEIENTMPTDDVDPLPFESDMLDQNDLQKLHREDTFGPEADKVPEVNESPQISDIYMEQ